MSYKLIPSLASGQYQLAKAEHAFGAQPTFRVNPIYPASLAGKHLADVTIRVKAIINTDGAVIEVRDLDPASDEQRSMFVEACKNAIMHWSFSPLVVVTETDDGHGNVNQSRSLKAFSLDYTFIFSSAQGGPTVLAGQGDKDAFDSEPN
ncbi:hypothetical protein FHW69_003742 [Luteibacter sp. Sphag1AF]|uniref:hypothetical protein n=1 Tax=Luteibacter sp. Sphag1AF TaxID=2587031 RepID=UPI00160CF7DB|nr:hypothetical protein [Luteibacter sp. Sphag1AF]MBB3229093.1 hypothetical protein [Luteibacter sp. Sphag1AF]